MAEIKTRDEGIVGDYYGSVNVLLEKQTSPQLRGDVLFSTISRILWSWRGQDGNHLSWLGITTELERANFLNPDSCRKTLLLHQIGFSTHPFHNGASMVILVSRTTISIHFSPFSRHSQDSIVSVPLSRPDASQIGGWVLPTIFVLTTLRRKRCSDFPHQPRLERLPVMKWLSFTIKR